VNALVGDERKVASIPLMQVVRGWQRSHHRFNPSQLMRVLGDRWYRTLRLKEVPVTV
jgi:hypothetical protein